MSVTSVPRHARGQEYPVPRHVHPGAGKGTAVVTVRRVVLAGCAISGIGVIAAGLAAAFVPSTGTASGTAAVTGYSLSAPDVEVDGLFPGRTTTARVTVSNSGPYTVALTTVAPETVGGVGDCPGSSVDIDGPENPLPTLDPHADAVVALRIHMPTNAAAACQGVTFTVPVHVSGTNR